MSIEIPYENANPTGLEAVSDAELLAAARMNAQKERGVLEQVLRHLCEIERRRLYAREGYKTMFQYCVKELGLSEGEAWRRVQVSRVCIKYPLLFEAVSEGKIHLASLSLIAPHLTDANWRDLLEKASRKSKREVERMVAPFLKRPERVDRVKFLGVRENLKSDAASGDNPTYRVEIAFSANERILKNLERVKDLLRSKIPDAKFEDAVAAGLDAWLEKHDPERVLSRKEKRAMKKKPPSRRNGDKKVGIRSRSVKRSVRQQRRIPQAVRDAVYKRDGGRCVFISRSGTRCCSRSQLEFDHRRPFSRGGRSDRAANIRLLCRTHNQESARQCFGAEKINAIIAAKRVKANPPAQEKALTKKPRAP